MVDLAIIISAKMLLVFISIILYPAVSCLELSGEALSSLSKIQLETKNLDLSTRCEALESRLRELAGDTYSGDRLDLIQQTIDILKNRSRVLNFNSPTLLVLNECLKTNDESKSANSLVERTTEIPVTVVTTDAPVEATTIAAVTNTPSVPRADPRITKLEANLTAVKIERNSYKEMYEREKAEKDDMERAYANAIRDMTSLRQQLESKQKELDKSIEAFSKQVEKQNESIAKVRRKLQQCEQKREKAKKQDKKEEKERDKMEKRQKKEAKELEKREIAWREVQMKNGQYPVPLSAIRGY